MMIPGKARSNPTSVYQWAVIQGAKNRADLQVYLDRIYRHAEELGLNADVLVAQSMHETADLATGSIPWSSVAWSLGSNPAGIGITDSRNPLSTTFPNGEKAAMAHAIHMYLYVYGDKLPLGYHEDDDPRWGAAVAAGRSSVAREIEDLNGMWAADKSYSVGILKWYRRMEAAGLLSGIGGSDMAAKTRTKPIIAALGMGHRNTGRGGAAGEYDWTPEATRALQRTMDRHNIEAYLNQEYDGDTNPNFSNVDRQSAASRAYRNITKEHGTIDVGFFMHYNSGGDGAHFLHVDGWDAPQRKVDNPSDLRMVRAIASHVGETGTVGLLTPRWSGISDKPGVMSERQSGAVANTRNWRLGELLAGDPYQASMRRCIGEAGNYASAKERAYIRDPRWVEHTYCEAIVAGIVEELGVYGDVTTPPVDPTPQEPEYDAAIRLPEIDAFREAPIERTPSFVMTHAEGGFFLIDREVTVIRQTPRYQSYGSDNGRTGKDLMPGEDFYAWFGTIASNGQAYVYTLWGTRIRLADTDLGVQMD
jgi:hypothetical protein